MMKLKINQERSFADAIVLEKPNSDLYCINNFLNWEIIAKDLRHIRTDYSVVSLLKALLIQVWYNLSGDRDISWVKKSKKLVYGYSSYMNVNKEGLVLSVGVTSANESEMKCFAEETKEQVSV